MVLLLGLLALALLVAACGGGSGVGPGTVVPGGNGPPNGSGDGGVPGGPGDGGTPIGDWDMPEGEVEVVGTIKFDVGTESFERYVQQNTTVVPAGGGTMTGYTGTWKETGVDGEYDVELVGVKDPERWGYFGEEIWISFKVMETIGADRLEGPTDPAHVEIMYAAGGYSSEEASLEVTSVSWKDGEGDIMSVAGKFSGTLYAYVAGVGADPSDSMVITNGTFDIEIVGPTGGTTN